MSKIDVKVSHGSFSELCEHVVVKTPAGSTWRFMLDETGGLLVHLESNRMQIVMEPRSGNCLVLFSMKELKGKNHA